MNNEYAESCRVISEYWALVAEGKSVRPLEYSVIGCGRPWHGVDINHIINPAAFCYRWKSETVKHPGGEYPKPCQSIEEVRNAPDPHASIINGHSHSAVTCPISEFDDETIDRLVRLGLAHRTKEAAKQHTRVMLGLGGSDEQ